MFIFRLLCLYLNYPNMTGAASHLVNFFERNSLRKHVVCCAMTHKHWGIMATFNLVFVMIPWTNVNIHLPCLAHAIKAFVKQKYISLFFFHYVLQKLFEVWSEPKTDQGCTFLFSTWKLTRNQAMLGTICSYLRMIYRISAFKVSSRVTLFSISDELARMDFVELSSLCSPLSDEADFKTSLASSLVVAGPWEETQKKFWNAC